MIHPRHFAFPFRFDAGRPAMVDQDSEDDIAQCVRVLVLTPLGSRDVLPDYGLDAPTFHVDFEWSKVESAVDRWEPRATVIVDDLAPDPTDADELLERVQVEVSAR